MMATPSSDFLRVSQTAEIQNPLEHQMTCVAEKITPELWEKIKDDLDPQYRLHIERRNLDENFVGLNRVVHVETGNYICHAPVMIRDKSSQWYFYVMKGHSICFRVDAPSRPKLEFYPGNEPSAEEYSEFQTQIAEIFGLTGFWLSVPGGSIFSPEFPVLKGGAK